MRLDLERWPVAADAGGVFPTPPLARLGAAPSRRPVASCSEPAALWLGTLSGSLDTL